MDPSNHRRSPVIPTSLLTANTTDRTNQVGVMDRPIARLSPSGLLSPSAPSAHNNTNNGMKGPPDPQHSIRPTNATTRRPSPLPTTSNRPTTTTANTNVQSPIIQLLNPSASPYVALTTPSPLLSPTTKFNSSPHQHSLNTFSSNPSNTPTSHHSNKRLSGQQSNHKQPTKGAHFNHSDHSNPSTPKPSPYQSSFPPLSALSLSASNCSSSTSSSSSTRPPSTPHLLPVSPSPSSTPTTTTPQPGRRYHPLAKSDQYYPRCSYPTNTTCAPTPTSHALKDRQACVIQVHSSFSAHSFQPLRTMTATPNGSRLTIITSPPQSSDNNHSNSCAARQTVTHTRPSLTASTTTSTLTLSPITTPPLQQHSLVRSRSPSFGSIGLLDSSRIKHRLNQRPILKFAIELGLLLLSSALIVALIIWVLLPPVSDADLPNLRIPTSFERLKKLNALLQIYKTENYYQVLGSFVMIYLFLQAFSLPGSMYLSILAGAMFGVKVGLPLVCLCVGTGAMMCYMISYNLAFNLVISIPSLRTRLENWRSKLSTKTNSWDLFAYLIVIRISPLPPHWVVNLLAPHVGIRLPSFWLSTCLGILPVSLIHTQLGTTLDQMASPDDLKLMSTKNLAGLGLVAVGVLVPVAIRWYLNPKCENCDLSDPSHLQSITSRNDNDSQDPEEQDEEEMEEQHDEDEDEMINRIHRQRKTNRKSIERRDSWEELSLIGNTSIVSLNDLNSSKETSIELESNHYKNQHQHQQFFSFSSKEQDDEELDDRRKSIGCSSKKMIF